MDQQVSPEKRAEWAVIVTTAHYQTAKAKKASDVLGFDVPTDMATAMERDLYGMAQARDALTPKNR